MKTRAVSCLALMMLSCETPPTVPSQDPVQNTALSNISGSLVVQSHARGDALVFLFDARNPPPPSGTGRPLAFTVIPETTLFGAALADTSPGPFTAPFSFSLVPPGTYLLQGFIDTRGTFIPWFNVTDEPNAGDVGGGAVDPVTHAPVLITINATTLAPVSGVTVGYTDAARIPIDRPSFSVCVPTAQGCPVQGTPAVFNPAALQPLVLELSPEALTVGTDTLAPLFLAQWVKLVNGVPQDLDGDPANGGDFWPKVLVRKVSNANPLNDENVDRRGLLTPNGILYPRVDGQSRQAAVALAAGFDPRDVMPYLMTDAGAVATPVPVPTLHLVIEPLAVDVTNPAAPVPLTSVPPGEYAIYVVQFSGQTWRVPNELGPVFSPLTGFGPTGIASQGFMVVVPDAG